MIDNINTIIARVARDKYGNIPKRNKIKEVDIESAHNLFKLIESKYSQAWSKFLEKKIIFRGISGDYFDYKILKPGLKVSENAYYNLYTRLLSGVLPSWKDYPVRNRSFICTSCIGKALLYGLSDNFYNSYEDIYVVLPINNSKIAICPKSDIWDSFPKTLGTKTLNEFQYETIDSLTIIQLEILNIEKNTSRYSGLNTKKYLNKFQENFKLILQHSTTNKIIQIFNNLSKKIDAYFFNIYENIKLNEENLNKNALSMLINKNAFNNSIKFLQELKQYDCNIINYLDVLLNPKINNFKLVNINDYNKRSAIQRHPKECGCEIWTNAECLFINYQWLIRNGYVKEY